MDTNIISGFGQRETPFYYYDLDLLKDTLSSVKKESSQYGFHVHYALKANSNPRILEMISREGLGADCVSGNEILRALDTGFDPSQVVFAGVGKTDKEIKIALESTIHCFNCESYEEVEVIHHLAKAYGVKANIALRINPEVDAHTHKHITTGMQENKFGIATSRLPEVMKLVERCSYVELIGMHVHIGSQITKMEVFRQLCERINELNDWFLNQGVRLKHINVGGGLGVNYAHPDEEPVADFKSYFKVFNDYLKIERAEQVHFELGRSIVAQCGSLVSRVTYIKRGTGKKFAIIDAGMTELMRPALYQSSHKIEALTSKSDTMEEYHIVGPICESTDSFGSNVQLKEIQRGDLLIIRSSGAYGEVMGNNYNLRDKVKSYYSPD